MKKIIGKLAVVLPRYGASLGGGAEALARSLVLDIVGKGANGPEFADCVEVWTTCARDHRTWANELPAGATTEDGVVVRRFPVDERDVSVFIAAEQKMASGLKLSVEEQLDWLAQSVNSTELYRHIAEHGAEFDAIIFAPYLFATSFWGPLIHPEKSILIPCLHNERYAYQEVFQYLFSKVRGVFFNAKPEQDLAHSIYKFNKGILPSAVIGMSFPPVSLAPRQQPTKPYLLYSGRKEQGKNLDLLIQAYSEMRESLDFDLDLVLTGAGDINFLESLPEGVIDRGFVSEAEKEQLMRNALALCQPSVNESFSIVIMEAWLRETPVIVHEQCAVTKHHVVSAGGGLYFSNAHELAAGVRYLHNNAEAARALGESGRRYVQEQYSTEAVLNRLAQTFVDFKLVADAAKRRVVTDSSFVAQ